MRPKGETSGWLAFPLRSLATVAGRPMLAGLKLALGSFRLFNAPTDQRLRALLKASRDAQAAVSTELAGQVLGALHELLRGLNAAEPALVQDLALKRPEHLYEGLLTVLLRLVFVLYAEDRDLLPSATDGASRALYEQSYALRGLYAKLTQDAALNPDTMDERLGGWGRLLALFRLIHKGHASGFIRARRGKLFDPDVFLFLEGREVEADAPRVIKVTDGCLLRILDGLMTLADPKTKVRQRLSYRALDVGNIGSVYETIMGFTVQTAPGRVLAIRAGKHNRTPVFADLDQLAALKPADRAKYLKEVCKRDGTLPKSVTTALAKAGDADAMAAALDAIADERGSPKRLALGAGTPILQPTEERRRTGSHYTPARADRADRPPRAAADAGAPRRGCDAGADPRPQAVRSGHGLRRVPGRSLPPAGRAAEGRLGAPPRRAPADPGRRGRGPAGAAPDRAALPLWRRQEPDGGRSGPALALARDARARPRVHLPRPRAQAGRQPGRARPRPDRGAALGRGRERCPAQPHPPLVRDRLAKVEAERRRIREAVEDASEDDLRPMLNRAQAQLGDPKLMGDAVIAAFFKGAKAKEREALRVEVQAAVEMGGPDWRAAAFSHHGRPPGHPVPLAARISRSLRPRQRRLRRDHRQPAVCWQEHHHREPSRALSRLAEDPARGRSRQLPIWSPTSFAAAFHLLREGGALGLIATNTIRQGDTRATGLRPIRAAGGVIYDAQRRIKWPGEAAVVDRDRAHPQRPLAGPYLLDDRPGRAHHRVPVPRRWRR